MKNIKYFFNIFVAILTVYSATSQNISGKATYKIQISKDFTMINKEKLKAIPTAYVDEIKKSMTALDQRIKLNIKYIENNLSFNQKEAIYKSISGLDNDGYNGLKEIMIMTGSYGLYYFNKNTNKKLRQIDAYGQLFLISSKLNARKWTLTQESKTIRGYLCYKATSTLVTKNSVGTFYKPVIAWYAPKLPVPYGPKGYGGLPGLILQLTEGDFTFYVSKLTLNPKKQVVIKKPTKGKKVSEGEFLAIGLQSTSHFGKFNH